MLDYVTSTENFQITVENTDMVNTPLYSNTSPEHKVHSLIRTRFCVRKFESSCHSVLTLMYGKWHGEVHRHYIPQFSVVVKHFKPLINFQLLMFKCYYRILANLLQTNFLHKSRFFRSTNYVIQNIKRCRIITWKTNSYSSLFLLGIVSEKLWW